MRPGRTAGELYDAHAAGLSAAGFGAAALKACGYSLGIADPPTWMDRPMVTCGNPQVIEADMVFFLHMILLDDTTGLTMSLGETAIVTDGAPEPVTQGPGELVVN